MFSGLGRDGFILINSTRSFEALGLGELDERFRNERLLTVPAVGIAPPASLCPWS